MFLATEEMKSVLYDYQMSEIVEADAEIIDDGIAAAISEVRAYFEARNNRREGLKLNAQQYAAYKLYDVPAIFGATGTGRNAFVLRLCKRVAAYNICELSNVDVVYDHVKERYQQAVATLEKIAGMGAYAGSQMFISELPSPAPYPNELTPIPLAFRAASRPKFRHE